MASKTTKSWYLGLTPFSPDPFFHPFNMPTLPVPEHKEVAKGTLRSLIRAFDLTVEEFIALTR